MKKSRTDLLNCAIALKQLYNDKMITYDVDCKERLFLAGLVEGYFEFIRILNGSEIEESRLAILNDNKLLNEVIDIVQRKNQ